MSLVEQIKNLQHLDCPTDEMKKLKSALDKYHKMVDDGVLVPRQNNLQNSYSGQINAQNLKWSNL